MSLADLHYPSKWALDRRRALQRHYVSAMSCPNKTIREGRECISLPADTFGLPGEGKGRQRASASGAAGGMGYWGATLTGSGGRGCLDFESFCTHFWFLSCWGERGKRKEVPCSHRRCYAPQQAPWQGRLPLALKRFRCLPCTTRSPPEI